jgi:adenylate cyclase class 2
MGFEVEVKYRSVDHDRLRRLLLARGALADPAVAQEDVYLIHPCRDFALTNEALRLRRTGEENRITYKGPRQGGPTKTREEIEIGIAAGELAGRQLLRLFENLGFRPVATIRKARTAFHLRHQHPPLEITLDRVDELGDFVEIEALAQGDAEVPAAQAAVLALAAELGLADVEPRSYLRMALEKWGRRPESREASAAEAGRAVPGRGPGAGPADRLDPSQND